jgi:formylglycine-generating enzyme required for sulfatase activity
MKLNQIRSLLPLLALLCIGSLHAATGSAETDNVTEDTRGGRASSGETAPPPLPPLVESPGNQTHLVGQELAGGTAIPLRVEGDFTRLEASGLPPGIRLDAASRSLLGRPISPWLNRQRELIPYEVQLRARGPGGVGPWVAFDWRIEPLPGGMAGKFEGLVARQVTVNGAPEAATGFGGGFQVTVSASGAASGRLRNGVRSGPLRGLVMTAADGSGGRLEAQVSRGRNQDPWEVDLSFDAATGAVTGSVKLSGQEATAEGWRLNSAPPAGRQGVFHVRLRGLVPQRVCEPGGDHGSPQGDGFARVTVNRRGAARAVGRMPEGTVLNVASGLGEGGELALFGILNGATGSVWGRMVINDGELGVAGELDWMRLPNPPRSRNRVHPQGISLTLLAAQGGRYSLSPDNLVLGLELPLEADNARLTLSGGVLGAGGRIEQILSVLAQNRLSLPAAGMEKNPRSVSLRLTPGTGLLSGGFRLDGTAPRSRVGVVQGLIISGLGGGFGYQLQGEPATPPTTDRTSPQRSGLVTLIRDTPHAGFSRIPGGHFTMGPTSGDTDEDAPPITVTLSPFYIQKTETTKAQWDEVRTWAVNNGYTNLAAGAGKAPNHPVQSVSWNDVVKWCNARSEKEGLSPCYYSAEGTFIDGIYRDSAIDVFVCWGANGYRLPTEAEWEKAARGGVSGKRFPWGTDTISHAQANYFGTSRYGYDQSPINISHPTYATGGRPYTSPVGSFAANGYGLYDMAGNVMEWCWDPYEESYYTTSNGASDPRGPSSGSIRVLRGGGSGGDASLARCSDRFRSEAGTAFFEFGFRPARSTVP